MRPIKTLHWYLLNIYDVFLLTNVCEVVTWFRKEDNIIEAACVSTAVLCLGNKTLKDEQKILVDTIVLIPIRYFLGLRKQEINY